MTTREAVNLLVARTPSYKLDKVHGLLKLIDCYWRGEGDMETTAARITLVGRALELNSSDVREVCEIANAYHFRGLMAARTQARAVGESTGREAHA